MASSSVILLRAAQPAGTFIAAPCPASGHALLPATSTFSHPLSSALHLSQSTTLFCFPSSLGFYSTDSVAFHCLLRIVALCAFMSQSYRPCGVLPTLLLLSAEPLVRHRAMKSPPVARDENNDGLRFSTCSCEIPTTTRKCKTPPGCTLLPSIPPSCPANNPSCPGPPAFEFV